MTKAKNGIQAWGEVVRQHSQKASEDRAAWQAELGEPAYFVPSRDPDMASRGFGTGYWVVDGGVVSYPKLANGYHPEPEQFYSSELIGNLNHLVSDPPASPRRVTVLEADKAERIDEMLMQLASILDNHMYDRMSKDELTRELNEIEDLRKLLQF